MRNGLTAFCNGINTKVNARARSNFSFSSVNCPKPTLHPCERQIIFHPAMPFSQMTHAWKCSDELHSLVPPILTFTTKIHHITYFVANKFHSLCISMVRFYWSSFFRQITALWNQKRIVPISLQS